MHLLFWMIDGMVVGWLSQLARGYRRNRIMDVVMGAAGAVAGGFFVIVSPFFVYGAMIFSNLGAILGAVVLIFLSRYLGPSQEFNATTLQRTPHMNRSKPRRVAAFMPPRDVAYARSRNEVM
jgi:uncharacterized membrane protein YeaQ/YmgE (transglycosylase-associated protein family)